MLSDLTPEEKMQLDTKKGINFKLRDRLVLDEQVKK